MLIQGISSMATRQVLADLAAAYRAQSGVDVAIESVGGVDAAKRVAAGERQAALPVPRGREVRALTESLEVMRAKLEQRHMLEDFVADLSHELKNPIASIRASTEVLFDALERDPESARRFVTRIDEAAQKLDHLTADLLTLARVEAHGQLAGASFALARTLPFFVVTVEKTAQKRASPMRSATLTTLWSRVTS